MNDFQAVTAGIQFRPHKQVFTPSRIPDQLKLIGVGRSAAAFKIRNEDKVIKVFFPNHHDKAHVEALAYEKVKGLEHFPRLYEKGRNYIVIDYIEGMTLFDHLVTGTYVKEAYIREVDAALESAKQRGLNPVDIHLRNIIVSTGGDVKLIDLARFFQHGDCRQWEDLKHAYYKWYLPNRIPHKIPAFILNRIAGIYHKRNQWLKRVVS